MGLRFDMKTDHRYKSARNGFLIASILLFGFLSVQFVQRREWDYDVGTAFFLSQVAFWASWVYYSR